MKKVFILKLTDEQHEDVRSAVSFTSREYERVSKQKAPSFLKGLAEVNKMLWPDLKPEPKKKPKKAKKVRK